MHSSGSYRRPNRFWKLNSHSFSFMTYNKVEISIFTSDSTTIEFNKLRNPPQFPLLNWIPNQCRRYRPYPCYSHPESIKSITLSISIKNWPLTQWYDSRPSNQWVWLHYNFGIRKMLHMSKIFIIQ